MALPPPLLFALLLAGAPAHAATNGMVVSMDDGLTLASGTMMTTLHFSLGDILWFADGKGEEKERRSRPQAPPFVPAHDVMRGAMHALQAILGFAFMLAVIASLSALRSLLHNARTPPEPQRSLPMYAFARGNYPLTLPPPSLFHAPFMLRFSSA
ncbi:hypothetical protein FB451DRAFT_1453063 [Mycena latifolia]|nr:hypothetical protein FB451DRAFT_1453063 [Mycena latifolia]